MITFMSRKKENSFDLLSILEESLQLQIKDLMNETFWLTSVQLCGKR